MDLSFRAIHDVVHPTAAFSYDANSDSDSGSDSGPHAHQARSEVHKASNSWVESQLNPKNRIDSLDLLPDPLWRIDGCAGLGTQYYAIPLFLGDFPPMRIDVFVHEGASYPPLLRELLDLDQAFHIKDASRLRRLGITRYILRILQVHTLRPDGALRPEILGELYKRGPFGSRIVLENLGFDVHDVKIVLTRNYPLEGDLLSYRELASLWGLREEDSMPPEISLHNLRVVQQLHDSVCVVRVLGQERAAGGDEGGGTLLILKSLTSSVKYMYHELRALLKDIPPHDNIIAKPRHIVSKQCLFGGKKGVVGFTILYHRTSSLRDVLPVLRIQGQLPLKDQLRWSTQLADAMCHIWHRGSSFYPDLRLDNIVLSDTRDVVMVDFEQRGVWCGFSAPEVDLIENLRILARDDPESGFAIPEDICEQYKEALAGCWGRGDWDALERLEEETKYSNPADGYNVTWQCLSKREQEAAMVYMLGRVLWCIFEGMSAPHRGAVWQSYPREPEIEFPTCSRTPPDVRVLIQECFGTVGAKEQSKFVRRASKLYMKKELEGSAGYALVSEDLASEAKLFWRERIEEGHEWLKERRLHQATGHHDDTQGRLTLKQVLARLTDLSHRLAS